MIEYGQSCVHVRAPKLVGVAKFSPRAKHAAFLPPHFLNPGYAPAGVLGEHQVSHSHKLDTTKGVGTAPSFLQCTDDCILVTEDV